MTLFKKPYDAVVVAYRDSRDTLAQFGSIVADAVTQSEILEKIPVVGGIVHALDAIGVGMKLKMSRNVVAFFEAASGSNPEITENAFKRIHGDPRFRDEIPDTVMQILLESHKPVKATLVGHLFIALGSEKLSLEEFETICLILLSISFPALKALEVFGTMKPDNAPIEAHFNGEEFLIGAGIGIRDRAGFRLTNFGCKLFHFGFNSSFPLIFR